jgi:hypothetical protein
LTSSIAMVHRGGLGMRESQAPIANKNNPAPQFSA